MVFSRKLTKKEFETIKQVISFVKDKHERCEGHDYSHVLEVVRLSIIIANKIKRKADPFILICGAALHDLGRVNNPYTPMHGLEGGAIVEEYLESLVEDHTIIDAIERIIVRHSPTSGIQPQSVEEKIVFDADTIERLGFMGMIRGIMGKTGTIQFILEDRIKKRLADYDKLFFKESKQLAKPYYKETLAVVKSLREKLRKRVSEVKELKMERFIEKRLR